jgi:hypothetical protein
MLCSLPELTGESSILAEAQGPRDLSISPYAMPKKNYRIDANNQFYQLMGRTYHSPHTD